MDTEHLNALIGFVVLPIIGFSLLLVSWGEEYERFFTLLGFAVLVIAVIYAAVISRVRAKAWSDWFPF